MAKQSNKVEANKEEPIAEKKVDATVMIGFADKKTKQRFYIGDVVTLDKSDYDRINKHNSKLLKLGRHRFGSGTCHPCNKNN